MRKIKAVKMVSKVMIAEALRPVGTVFEQKIDGKWVRVSRLEHLRYMFGACMQVVKGA